MQQQEKIKVWDLPVRVFHWSLVTFFVIAYITGEELDTVHAWSGYVVTGLIVFRIIWGFIGTRHARFGDFVYSRREVKAYIKSLFSRSPRHYLGHNPAGGWMVLILLVSLALTCWTGLEAYGAEGRGPLASVDASPVSTAYADDDSHEKNEEGNEFWEEIHEFFVNFTLLMVFVHIAGVLVSSVLHGENLVKAMVRGYKNAPLVRDVKD